MFQYDGKPVKKWSGVFALMRLKPNPLESSMALPTSSRPAVRHDAAPPHGQGRHEHIGQEVHQVVERLAAEPGEPLGHACPPCQPAVGGIHRDLQPQVEERRSVVALDDRDRPPGRPARSRWRCRGAPARPRRWPGFIGTSYRRRTTAGKSLHTGTPQKWVPSVHRGEIEAVADHAGRADVPADRGCTARTCSISSIDAR